MPFADFVGRVEAGNFEFALQFIAPPFADPSASVIPLAGMLEGAEFAACAEHLVAAQQREGGAWRQSLLRAQRSSRALYPSSRSPMVRASDSSIRESGGTSPVPRGARSRQVSLLSKRSRHRAT